MELNPTKSDLIRNGFEEYEDQNSINPVDLSDLLN